MKLKHNKPIIVFILEAFAGNTNCKLCAALGPRQIPTTRRNEDSAPLPRFLVHGSHTYSSSSIGVNPGGWKGRDPRF